jgi:hypothetical protein
MGDPGSDAGATIHASFRPLHRAAAPGVCDDLQKASLFVFSAPSTQLSWTAPTGSISSHTPLINQVSRPYLIPSHVVARARRCDGRRVVLHVQRPLPYMSGRCSTRASSQSTPARMRIRLPYMSGRCSTRASSQSTPARMRIRTSHHLKAGVWACRARAPSRSTPRMTSWPRHTSTPSPTE